MNLIAFTGRAGSGKTTLADELVNLGYTKLSFATPVKQFYQEIFGVEPDKTDPSVRDWLQTFGTDLCRGHDNHVWIRHMADALQAISHLTNKVVIDDCRFRNEARFLRDLDFLIIKTEGRQHKLTEAQRNHSSEQETDLIIPDFTIDNSKSIEDSVKQLLRKLSIFECGVDTIIFDETKKDDEEI